MNALKLGDATTVRHATVALEEAMTNAMYHGNLELTVPQMREARHAYREGGTYELVTQRLDQQPYQSRKIIVAIDLSKTKAQFIVRDQGDGFDASVFAGVSEVAHLSDLKDRGLTLIKNFMDEVEFNEEGNEIRMTLNTAQTAAVPS